MKLSSQLYLLRYGLVNDNRIFTHLTKEEKISLHKILKYQKSFKSIVEIGSYYGSSSCFLANGSAKEAKLFCIDTWKNHNMIGDRDDPNDINLLPHDTFEVFLKNTNKYQKKIIPVRGWSYEVINLINKKIDKIDFLFIDGDHTYEGVKRDWSLYFPFLKTNSIVVFHDTAWAEGVQRVIANDVVKVSVLILELPNMKMFQIQ